MASRTTAALRRAHALACLLCCALLFGGCGSSEGIDADTTPNPCAGVVNLCDAEGTSCDADQLVHCVLDLNGCLTETRVDCATTGGACALEADGAMCLAADPCLDNPAPCDAPSRACDGDTLTLCEADLNGCLTETRIDCAANDSQCALDNGGQPVCLGLCDTIADPCPVAERACQDGQNLRICTHNLEGCLTQNIVACPDGGRCIPDDALGGRCASACDLACDGVTPDTPSCNGNLIENCTDLNGDGCFDHLVTNCGVGSCDDSSGQPVCDSAGVFIVGTWNFLKAPEPEFFVPIADNGPLPFYQGFQGTWMSIISFKTNSLLTEPIDFTVSLELEDGNSAYYERTDYRFIDGGDGYSYHYDSFVDIGVYEPPIQGTPTTLTIHAEGALGVQVDITYSMTVGELFEF